MRDLPLIDYSLTSRPRFPQSLNLNIAQTVQSPSSQFHPLLIPASPPLSSPQNKRICDWPSNVKCTPSDAGTVSQVGVGTVPTQASVGGSVTRPTPPPPPPPSVELEPVGSSGALSGKSQARSGGFSVNGVEHILGFLCYYSHYELFHIHNSAK